MDIVLSEANLQDWVRRLDSHLSDLRDRFGPEVLHNPLFKAMSVEDNDRKLRLEEIHTGADVLHAVQCFMGLAVGSDVLATDSKEQPTVPKIHQDENDRASDPIYLSVPLHDPESQTRLIELLPGRDGDPIRINLFAVDSLSSQPYKALSYVWGPRDADVTVCMNGRTFNVSANLSQALHCLRSIESNKVLWVDAICINQVDDVEKSYQVSLMGEIYRSAEEVVIFLGEERDDSAMVMQYLNLDDGEQTESQSPTRDAVNEDTRIEKAVDRSIVQERIQRCGFDSGHFLRAADAFFKRPWWSRLWVVQEYQLAKREPRWYCGRLWTSTANMSDRLEKLYTHLISEAVPVGGNLTVSRVDIEREWIKMHERRWNMKMLLRFRESLKEAQQPYGLMIRMLHRQSTDPRDRIFALREMLDPISRQVFVPNYAATVNEIFVKLASYLLIHNEHGHIYDLYELARSRDMPSWTLDFTNPFSEHGVSHLTPYATAPASWAKNVGHLSIYNSVLGVSGVEVDTLDVAECFDDASDIVLLGKFWKLEGLLQKFSPLEALPDVARPSLPSYCLVPFSSLREHLRKAGADLMSNQFPILPIIPGYPQACIEAMKLLLTLRMPSPKSLICEAQQPCAPLDLIERMTKLVEASMKSPEGECVIGGAFFDLSNLKTQIMSVRLSEHNHHDLASPQELSDVKASQGNEAETPRSSGHYCPQYSHIKEILRQAKSQIELDILKNLVCRLADLYCKIVAQGIAKRGPPGTQLMAEFESAVSAIFTANDSYLREISEKCTCGGDERNGHQKVLKDLREANEKVRDGFPASVASFGRSSGGFEVMPELNMTVRRQYTAIFISRLGFFGVSLQRRPDLKKGNKVVVFDGIPAPMILEETGDGATYRMKAAVDVVGIKHVDIARLVELGVCRRRDYKII